MDEGRGPGQERDPQWLISCNGGHEAFASVSPTSRSSTPPNPIEISEAKRDGKESQHGVRFVRRALYAGWHW
jgi:hypothetical protein